NSSTPLQGAAISYTLTLASAAGSQSASNVTVKDLLPPGVSFVSASGYGSYDAATGIWTVPSIAAGNARVLTINATVTASAGAP
ncbi:DUF11 domain-containing protein, partial [Klebsiella pneumoniae]|nr:DUF11 domain-containing protein [Klebsiella pneumoniae]